MLPNMADLEVGGDYVNVLIMERMLMDQKKQYQYIMEQRNKKLVKLKHKVGKLKNTIEFLKATAKNHKNEECPSMGRRSCPGHQPHRESCSLPPRYRLEQLRLKYHKPQLHQNHFQF